MAHITIRETPAYKITFADGYFYANGRRAFPLVVAPEKLPAQFAMLIDTTFKGANGKRDLVGLTAEHVAIYKAAMAEHEAHIAALIATEAALPRTAHQIARERADAFDAAMARGFHSGRFES